MRKNKLKIIALLIVFLLSSKQMIYAQGVLSLSSNLDNTEAEIKQIYENVNSNQKEEAGKILGMFPDFWQQMSDDEQISFIEIANIMFKHQLKPIPHLSNFIYTYQLFVESNQSAKSSQNFVKSMKYIASNNLNQFNNLMKTYQNILKYFYGCQLACKRGGVVLF